MRIPKSRIIVVEIEGTSSCTWFGRFNSGCYIVCYYIIAIFFVLIADTQIV